MTAYKFRKSVDIWPSCHTASILPAVWKLQTKVAQTGVHNNLLTSH